MAVRLIEKSLGSIALLLHKDLLVADEMKVFYIDSEYAKFSCFFLRNRMLSNGDAK